MNIVITSRKSVDGKPDLVMLYCADCDHTHGRNANPDGDEATIADFERFILANPTHCGMSSE